MFIFTLAYQSHNVKAMKTFFNFF